MHKFLLRDYARLCEAEVGRRSGFVDQYVSKNLSLLTTNIYLSPRQKVYLFCRYAFDVLGELFYCKMFGFMSERTDISNYMKAIDSLLPAFTIGGTVPSYLTKLYLLSTILFSPSIRGALGAVKHIEIVSETAVKRRKQEIEDNKDNKRDILRKMLEINADRGEKINFTYPHIYVESHSLM